LPKAKLRNKQYLQMKMKFLFMVMELDGLDGLDGIGM
jgi:hypothetical protein